MRSLWRSTAPLPIMEASAGARSVVLIHLLHQLGPGGGRWLMQFAYGFSIACALHRRTSPPCGRVFPTHRIYRRYWRMHNNAFAPAHPAICFRMPFGERLRTRSQKCGPPPPHTPNRPHRFDSDGRVPGFTDSPDNAAFRFAVAQMGKNRAFGDFEYGRINTCCATRTPTMPPTWSHIGKCASKFGTRTGVSLFKADRKAVYKNMPPKPDDAQFAIAALMSHTANNWYGSPPRAPLFGEAEAVLRYN